jgi:tetratricopeptide (TPR) repeat protein
VHEALARSNYDQAFAALETASRRFTLPAEQARLSLQLAAVHSLYGPAGVSQGWHSLEAAGRLDSRITLEPLYNALYWEFKASQGAPARLIRRGAAELKEAGDAAAHYHAASALYQSGAVRASLSHLHRALQPELPAFLRWRCHSLRAILHEQLGQLEKSRDELEQAVQLSRGADQQSERLSLAACLLELDEPAEAVSVLNQIDDRLLAHPREQIHRMYLLGRGESGRGNPSLALGWFSRARSSFRQLEDGSGQDEEAYLLVLSEAQLLSDLGQLDEARERYHEALGLAPDGFIAHGHHELAVALADAGELDAAEEELDLALLDEDYAYRPEALAELAEIHLRQGNNELAEETARRALAVRPVAAAFICLGSSAFDYYRLDEAVSWFEQALAAAEPESSHWILAQQLLADTFAQMGPESASRLYQHASTALRYTDRSNDWYLPLRSHQERASISLQVRRRLVN